ncbi:MAG: cytochrome-c peroxidase, partial [Bacteroidia bacterium]|nr:cytochrome-c peroxidase [Bacteroidia bacterium]
MLIILIFEPHKCMAFYPERGAQSVKKNKGVLSIVTICAFVIFMQACSPKKDVKYLATEEDLGEALVFDPVLSRDSSLSCAGCHKPEFAFADNTALSNGVFGRHGKRNTPTVMNQGARNFYFWDGRAETLEEQALGPMENHVEMDFPLTLTIRRLQKNEMYKQAFYRIYGEAPSKARLAEAIAAYERTLETSNTIFDSYVSGNDTTLMSESAKRGLNIFNTKGKCFDCHFGVDFTGSDRF